MNQAILLESNADNIDFMIHGIFSIKVFGQEVWITTSHACILIVMAIMVIFAIVANRKLKKSKGSTGRLSEYHRAHRRDARQDGRGNHG